MKQEKINEHCSNAVHHIRDLIKDIEFYNDCIAADLDCIRDEIIAERSDNPTVLEMYALDKLFHMLLEFKSTMSSASVHLDLDLNSGVRQ